MHPSKRAVKVKEVIGVLCKLLTATGLDSVPTPEVFRRAKFNCGPEVEDPFWRLLASVLKTCNIISVDASPKLPGTSDYRKLVAVGLWQNGYHIDWIKCVRERGEECNPCSRDLLLALGWLLATGTLETMLAHRAQQLDSTWLEPAGVTPPTVHGAQMDHSSLRKLQWLIGSLRFQRRSLLSMQEEWSKLMNMVLSVCFPSSSSSSSTFISDSNSALQEECVRMQELCHLLKSYVDWKHTEKLFWAWMDSVVECHATDKREVCLVDQDAKVSANRSRAVCHHGNQRLECFNYMLLGLLTVQEMRGQRREKEEPRRRWVTEGDDKLLAERDSRTLPDMLQTSSPLSPCLSTHISPGPLRQAYRVRLQGETEMPHSCSPAEKPSYGAVLAGKLQASEASRLLLLTEASLLERKERCQRANRMQLQEMIGRLEDLVLIAP
ncbi:unnamed protein product [Lota lota]